MVAPFPLSLVQAYFSYVLIRFLGVLFVARLRLKPAWLEKARRVGLQYLGGVYFRFLLLL
jgi:hypothetical protein